MDGPRHDDPPADNGMQLPIADVYARNRMHLLHWNFPPPSTPQLLPQLLLQLL